MKPYALAAGEGRSYEWHDVVFTIKAAAAETGGALAIWEVTTRPGEEPHSHVHEEDEIFYLISGRMTFRCGEETFEATDGGFVFVPRGTPHTYTVHSDEVRLIGMSTPSSFADNIEQTGRPVEA
jgi:quercetin dioxygenase-like cupin family protein